MADYRNRVTAAMLKNHAKHLRKAGGSSRKNGKPEQLVVKAILEFAKSQGWDLHVVESKAVYSASAGRYLHSQTSESLPDLLGNYQGLSIWIECKALGRVSTLKEHQRAFLARKATQGCFACVADSVEMVRYHFNNFTKLSDKDRVIYLMKYLEPKKSHVDEASLF